MVNPENVVKTMLKFNDTICKLLSVGKKIEAKEKTDEMARYFTSMLDLASKDEKLEMISLLNKQENKTYFSRASSAIIFVNEFKTLFDVYAKGVFTESNIEPDGFETSLKQDTVKILISAYYDKGNAVITDSMAKFVIDVFKEFECIKLVNKLKNQRLSDIEKIFLEIFK